MVERLGNRIEVRGKLAVLGWESVAEWAEAHGYDRKLATYTVQHWANRDTEPYGLLVRHLMRALRKTLATGRRPQDVPPVVSAKQGN